MSRVVKCMCEECHYNHNFNCHANEIEVRSSTEGNRVVSSEGTCCSTFKHGGKNNN